MPWPRSPRRCRARSSTSRTSFTPGADGAQLLEGLARVGGDGLGEGGLAGAGRSPEDHRRQPVGLDERPQRLARRPAAAPARRCRRACGAAGAPRAARWPTGRPPPPRRTGRQPSPDDPTPTVTLRAFTVHLSPSPTTPPTTSVQRKRPPCGRKPTQTSGIPGGLHGNRTKRRGGRARAGRSTASSPPTRRSKPSGRVARLAGSPSGASSPCSQACSGWLAPRRPGTRASSPRRSRSTGIVSHRSAAELWGLIQPAGYVEVSVAGPGEPRRAPARDRPPDHRPPPRAWRSSGQGCASPTPSARSSISGS